MSGARRVIVGASGSPGSLRALRHAEALARHSVATLTPVLAWVPPGGELAARQPCPALVHIWQDAAWQRLWAALEAAWGQVPAGLSVQPVVQRGQPGPVLVAFASRPDDLLIVGAGQRGFMAWPGHGRVSRSYCTTALHRRENAPPGRHPGAGDPADCVGGLLAARCD